MSGALTAQQLTDFRTSPYAVDGFIYLSQPTVVFKALVNGDVTTYPATQLSFDNVSSGSYTNIKAEYIMTIGSSDGAWDYGIQRVRSATSSVITFPRTSVGGGFGELTIADNAYITIYKERRAWAKIPYIRPSDGVAFKDDTSFVAANAQPPVANCGPDRLFIVSSSTATQSVDFDGTGSFTVASGATISTYLWDVDGGSITSGTTASSSITVDFTNTGERYVSLTVTDSNGKSHTAWCWIVLAEETDCIQATVSRETIKPDSVEWEFEVFGSDLPSPFLPGSRVLYAQTEYWSTSTGQIVGNETRFSGFVQQNSAVIQARKDGNLERTITVPCVDIAGRLKELPGFPQAVDRASSPANWYEMANADIDRMLHYILYWHSTACEIADVTFSGKGSSYPFPGFEVQQGSLFDQMGYLANAVAHRFVCNTSGQLMTNPDPILMPTSDQKTTYGLPYSRTTTVRITLDADDYTELTFEDRVTPSSHWLWAEAIAPSTGTTIVPIFCVAPGLTPGQGVASQSLSKQIGTKYEFLARAGHQYAARVNPSTKNVRLKLLHGGWVWEPADLEWVQVTLSSDVAAQNGVTWSSKKMLLLQVDNTYNHENGSKETWLTLEPEVIGQVATPYDKPEPQQLTDIVIDPITFPSFDNNFDAFLTPLYTEAVIAPAIDLPLGTQTIGGIVNKPSIGAFHIYTETFGEGDAAWTANDLTGSIVDEVIDVIVDPYTLTDFFVVTENEIWRVADAATSSPSLTLLHTFTYSSSAGRIIKWCLADPQFISVLSSYTTTETGGARGDVYVDWTVNGGSSWSTLNVSSALGTGYSDTSTRLGLVVDHVNPGQAWFFYWNGASGGNGMPAKMGKTTDFWASVDFADDDFNTLQTQSYLSIYQAGSQQSEIAYTHMLGDIRKIYYEKAVTGFGGVSYIQQRDSSGNDTWPTYPGDETVSVISRCPRAIVLSWTNAAVGASVRDNAIYTSKNLPNIWQNKVAINSWLAAPQGLHMSSDNKTIYVYGRSGIVLSTDFGVTASDQRGDLNTVLSSSTYTVYGLIGG